LAGELFDALQDDVEITGVLTGFPALDELTRGFRPGQLIIIGGRTGTGKSSLALNIARNVAVEQHKAVAFFSLEMPKREIMERLLSAECGIETRFLKKSSLNHPGDWQRITGAIDCLRSAGRIEIDASGDISIQQIQSRARKMKRQTGHLDLVVCDYLQLVDTARREARESEVSAIARSLKAMAKSLDVPVLALSQFNRAADGRGDKKPILSDLRESGEIEQAADCAMLIYCPELNKPDGDRSKVELIIAKQRSGPSGRVVKMRFNQGITKFEEGGP